MTKIELIGQISNILNEIISDDVVSQEEINILQDWLDENSVEFCDNEYIEFILPLQKYIEDGELTNEEIESIKKKISEINGLNI